MSTSLTISLPDELREFIDAQVADGAFPSTSAYLQQLVRRQRAMVAMRDRLRAAQETPLLTSEEFWRQVAERRAERAPE